MLAHTYITVLIREHERKTHLHHDEQGMEIPYDNGRILFKRDPVSRGYAAESGNALTVQAARLFIDCTTSFMKRYFSFFFKFLEFAAHDHFNGTNTFPSVIADKFLRVIGITIGKYRYKLLCLALGFYNTSR